MSLLGSFICFSALLDQPEKLLLKQQSGVQAERDRLGRVEHVEVEGAVRKRHGAWPAAVEQCALARHIV